MEFLQKTVDLFAKAPDWAYLYLLPALIIASAVAFVFSPQRRWYFCAATVFSAAGFVLVYAQNPATAFIYLGAVVALSALLTLLFLIPRPTRREKGVKKSRVDALYEKFREELSEKPYAPRADMPPKVCRFERDHIEGATATEQGVSLSYADSLLERLRAKDLNAGDRLETEELSRRLDYYRDKPLTESERSTLNDCLASILKLTAKYQL